MKTTKWLIHELRRLHGRIRYNIIIGGNEHNERVAAYCKTLAGFQSLSFVTKEELKKYEYEFSDKEIREIKSKLPKHLATIVELGKVEVKDD